MATTCSSSAPGPPASGDPLPSPVEDRLALRELAYRYARAVDELFDGLRGGSSLDASYDRADWSRPWALVIGSEAPGETYPLIAGWLLRHSSA